MLQLNETKSNHAEAGTHTSIHLFFKKLFTFQMFQKHKVGQAGVDRCPNGHYIPRGHRVRVVQRLQQFWKFDLFRFLIMMMASKFLFVEQIPLLQRNPKISECHIAPVRQFHGPSKARIIPEATVGTRISGLELKCSLNIVCRSDAPSLINRFHSSNPRTRLTIIIVAEQFKYSSLKANNLGFSSDNSFHNPSGNVVYKHDVTSTTNFTILILELISFSTLNRLVAKVEHIHIPEKSSKQVFQIDQVIVVCRHFAPSPASKTRLDKP